LYLQAPLVPAAAQPNTGYTNKPPAISPGERSSGRIIFGGLVALHRTPLHLPSPLALLLPADAPHLVLPLGLVPLHAAAVPLLVLPLVLDPLIAAATTIPIAVAATAATATATVPIPASTTTATADATDPYPATAGQHPYSPR
jgi:hypothetical protein